MFNFHNKEYDNVWFTSDEHYGSDRHITLSKRLEFDETLEIYKKLSVLEPTCFKKLRACSVYGMFGETIKTPVDKMNDEIIDKHNLRVGDNDLVFHIGDFGDYECAKYLNGHHVLLMGNYEYDDCNKKYGGNIDRFREDIVSKYNFIDVCPDYILDMEKMSDNHLTMMLKDEVSFIYMTHKPADCVYYLGHDGCNSKIDYNNNKHIMNLFGHIHEKGKVKRFGLNVGVDCNYHYPTSSVEVTFYLKAILHHYDENVFM